MTWDMAIRVSAPEAAGRSSYAEGAGNGTRGHRHAEVIRSICPSCCGAPRSARKAGGPPSERTRRPEAHGSRPAVVAERAGLRCLLRCASLLASSSSPDAEWQVATHFVRLIPGTGTQADASDATGSPHSPPAYAARSPQR